MFPKLVWMMCRAGSIARSARAISACHAATGPTAKSLQAFTSFQNCQEPTANEYDQRATTYRRRARNSARARASTKKSAGAASGQTVGTEKPGGGERRERVTRIPTGLTKACSRPRSAGRLK